MKIVICVEGGNVQGVYSTDDNIAVELVDFDNLEAEGQNWVERYRVLDEATIGLHAVL